jgi:hypothetical protein
MIEDEGLTIDKQQRRMMTMSLFIVQSHVRRGTFPSSSCLLSCGTNVVGAHSLGDVAGARSLGDVTLPHCSCCAGCRQLMWMEAGVVDGDDSMTVAMR